MTKTDRELDPSRVDEHGQVPLQLLQTIREHEHDLAETPRLAHLGGWAWHIASDEVTWSDQLYRIFGVTAEEFTPGYEAYFSMIHPDHRVRAEALVQAALGDGQQRTYECPIRRPDGEQRWIRSVCIVDVDPAGAPIRMHGTTQDITEFRGDDAAAYKTGAGNPGLHDPLTGLARWHLFVDRAATVLARGARNGSPTALLVIDIDGFHHVNDRFGHEAGDLVLVEVARRLHSGFRPYDTVARLANIIGRLGGDEFIVLCESVPDTVVALTLCRRVAALLKAPIGVDGGEVLVTAAVGAALVSPGGADVEASIVQADTAMRGAKQRGHGAHSIFAKGRLEADGDLGEAGQALERALIGGQLRLHYQPKVALTTDRIVGVEALMRWQHPERGLVPPLEFIPLAEETGLIVPIGAWVIEEACREASRWRRSFPNRPTLVVSVNVSARQFGPALVDVVAAALSASATQPGALCIEVTESLLMDDVEGSVAILTQLAGLGVALSIDDFGTGYSSLAYLKRFPLHELKVDKSFVDGLAKNADDTAIVAAVVAMAHALGLSVVAEGVETAEQLQRLRTLGCDQVQGFHIARPAPAEAIDILLRAEASASWLGHGSQPPDAPPESYRPQRILVVDDTADVRQLAHMSLAAMGFEVHEAADGASALARAKLIGPDCILLDLVMPGIGGMEVCRALRADPATADCTIVMLTSQVDPADKVEAFSLGADDYIIKPFSPRDLGGRVHAAMRRRRQAAEPLDAPGGAPVVKVATTAVVLATATPETGLPKVPHCTDGAGP